MTPGIGRRVAGPQDARCHGNSDDAPFTSTPRFAEDNDAGLRWLHTRDGIDGKRIALLGHSVGAAAAIHSDLLATLKSGSSG